MGHCCVPSGEDASGKAGKLGVVERFDHLAAGAEATADAQAVVPVDERRKPVPDQRVQLRPVLASDLDDVLESSVRDEHDFGATAFKESVGRNGGSVEESERLACSQDPSDAVENGLSRIVRCRRHLERLDPALVKQYQVGERAACVDGQDGR